MSAATPIDETTRAFEAGKRAGLATAALVIAVVSFISLLGTEKAIVAIALGILAARGSPAGSAARRFGITAVVLGGVFLATVAVVLIVWWDKLVELVKILERMS